MMGFMLFFFQAEDGITAHFVTGVQTCALPICPAVPDRRRGTVLDSSHDERRRELRSGREQLDEPARSQPGALVHSRRQIGRASCRETNYEEFVTHVSKNTTHDKVYAITGLLGW